MLIYIWRIVFHLFILFTKYSFGLFLCNKNNHKTGRWRLIHNSSSISKSFHCCGVNLNSTLDDYVHDTKICGAERGDWDVVIGNTPRETHIAGNACYCDSIEGRDTLNRRESYEWVPDSCYLLQWDGMKFCELLGNKTILFVGDSTMQQSSTTVMSMITKHGGKCANQLIYGRSYMLTRPYSNSSDIYSFIKQFKPSICIMGAGAWCKLESNMYAVLNDLQAKWSSVLKWSPHTKYYWKTINPGHYNCENVTQPVNTFVNQVEPQFNWFSFPSYDKAAYDYAHNLSWSVIDMSPLYLRPDAHTTYRNGPYTDCLHFCAPGPLNILGNIMLTMLHTGEM